MIPTGTEMAPRLFTEETCPPARLTSAEVISRPEVCSARSTERVMACVAVARSTTTPLRIPSDGSMPTPMMRMVFSLSIRPTSVHTLVVPTSMPTMISSMSLAHSVVRRVGILNADERRIDAALGQRIDQRLVDLQLQTHVLRVAPKEDLPAAAIGPAQPVMRIIDQRGNRGDIRSEGLDCLDQIGGNVRDRRQRIMSGRQAGQIGR